MNVVSFALYSPSLSAHTITYKYQQSSGVYVSWFIVEHKLLYASFTPPPVYNRSHIVVGSFTADQWDLNTFHWLQKFMCGWGGVCTYKRLCWLKKIMVPHDFHAMSLCYCPSLWYTTYLNCISSYNISLFVCVCVCVHIVKCIYIMQYESLTD